MRVLVVRPGFVTTRMTEGLKPAPFSTTAEAVAEATVGALGTRAHTIWVPGQLRWLFVILRHLPRRDLPEAPAVNLDNPFVVDVAAAVVIALIVLIVSPGAAVDAILVLILLVICGVAALITRRRGGGPRLRGAAARRLRAAASARGDPAAPRSPRPRPQHPPPLATRRSLGPPLGAPVPGSGCTEP